MAMDRNNTMPASGRDCAELERTILQLARSIDDLHGLVAELLLKNQRLRYELHNAKLNASQQVIAMKFVTPIEFESKNRSVRDRESR